LENPAGTILAGQPKDNQLLWLYQISNTLGTSHNVVVGQTGYAQPPRVGVGIFSPNRNVGFSVRLQFSIYTKITEISAKPIWRLGGLAVSLGPSSGLASPHKPIAPTWQWHLLIYLPPPKSQIIRRLRPPASLVSRLVYSIYIIYLYNYITAGPRPRQTAPSAASSPPAPQHQSPPKPSASSRRRRRDELLRPAAAARRRATAARFVSPIAAEFVCRLSGRCRLTPSLTSCSISA
jgi:hypothetical protein